MKSVSTELQYSFEKSKKDKLSLKVSAYRHDFNLYNEKIAQNNQQVKETFIEEFTQFMTTVVEDDQMFDNGDLQELLKDMIKLYSDRVQRENATLKDKMKL